jgi:hypothetical protein
MLLAAFALLGTPATAGVGTVFPPATSSAILAGAQACVGAVMDPAGQDKRLIGWTPALKGKVVVATAPAKKGAKGKPVSKVVAAPTGGGRIYTRDNVLLVLKTGSSGGCVVDARVDPEFDRKGFYTELGTQLGVPVLPTTDGSTPVVSLPNGERMSVLVAEAGNRPVKLIVLKQTN